MSFLNIPLAPEGCHGGEGISEIRRQRLLRIDAFFMSHQMMGGMVDGHGRRMVLLDDLNLPAVESTELDKYLAHRPRAEAEGITISNCYDVARFAVRRGGLKGVLGTRDGAQDMVRGGNHRLNYDVLLDKTLIVVDFTAYENISSGAYGSDETPFHVLALRAANMQTLLLQLNELYGGEWSKIKPWRQ